MVTPQNKVICCDAGAMKCLTELFQPSSETEAAFTPLAARLVQLLEGIPTDSWYCCPLLRLRANPHAHMGWQGLAENYHHPIIPTSLPPIPSGYFREMIRRDIRRAREMYRGEQLSRELARIQQRLDSMELLSLDIVVNLLLSYRDVQVRGFKHPGEVPGTTSASRGGFAPQPAVARRSLQLSELVRCGESIALRSWAQAARGSPAQPHRHPRRITMPSFHWWRTSRRCRPAPWPSSTTSVSTTPSPSVGERWPGRGTHKYTPGTPMARSWGLRGLRGRAGDAVCQAPVACVQA